ncbi:type IV pilin [Natrarchaeobius oligotrophus]|uniref:Type IV pilin n=1 Tax=Natrarchaeobius chitinivorans TaxID=1679083 RepID=A0A3N6PG77_NATCH|nr:type IV pilin [Natrarchaeobius chitinivorans]RQG96705.1 type IV pilin [Natrarchaeobius chitinivorans]
MSAGFGRRRTGVGCDEERGVSPLVGVLALVAITVCLAAVVAIGAAGWSIGSAGPTAAFELSASSETNVVSIDHVAGDAIDVRELSLAVEIDGEPLSEQPPVPFVGAEGFEGTPSGPFNERADPEWRSGERASFVVATNNEPDLESGESIAVRLAVDGSHVATLESTVE